MLVRKDTRAGLEIIAGTNLAALNFLGNLLRERGGSDIKTVVLVGRLGERNNRRVTGDGFSVLDDGGRDPKRNTCVVLGRSAGA